LGARGCWPTAAGAAGKRPDTFDAHACLGEQACRLTTWGAWDTEGCHAAHSPLWPPSRGGVAEFIHASNSPAASSCRCATRTNESSGPPIVLTTPFTPQGTGLEPHAFGTTPVASLQACHPPYSSPCLRASVVPPNPKPFSSPSPLVASLNARSSSPFPPSVLGAHR